MGGAGVVGRLRVLCRNGTGRIFHASSPRGVVVRCGSTTATFGGVGGTAVRGGNILGGTVSALVFGRLRGTNVGARCVRAVGSHSRVYHGIAVVPLRIVIHGVVTNSVTRHLNVRRNARPSGAVCSVYCGGSRLNSPLVGSRRTMTLNTIACSRLSLVCTVASHVGRILQGVFTGVGVGLISFGVRFNHASSNRVILTSRISPSAYHL